MKMTKSDYEDMIRKKPSLRPTEVIKPQNTHKGFVEEFREKLRAINDKIDPEWEKRPDYQIEEEKPVKSPRTLVFTIPGQPVGKPRQTQSDRWNKRPCVMRYRAWADIARKSMEDVFVHPAWRGCNASFVGFREVHFVAYLQFPKSYSENKRSLLKGSPHLMRIDVDNICKSILDALFKEDRQIWKVSGEKRWEDSGGARIEVELK